MNTKSISLILLKNSIIMPLPYTTNLPVVVFSVFLSLICGERWDLPMNESVGIGLSLYFIIKIIKNLGRTVWIFLDIISLILISTCLVAPLFFYHHFDETNGLAQLYVKYMPVPAEAYFGYALPASLALIIGFNIPFIRRLEFNYSIKEYAQSGQLSRPIKLGFQLIIINLFAGFVRPLLPSALNFVVFLFNKLVFIGFLYMYFSSKKPNFKWLIIAGGLLFFQSLQAAMFGELIFMSLLSIVVFTYGNKYRTVVKAGVIALGLFAVVIIQSVKFEYRKTVWGDGASDSGTNVALFTNLAAQKTQDVDAFLSEEKLFFTAVRFNQGWLVASVMKNVPQFAPYANGETIWKSLLASIAPRFLWPDKPKAGGKENLKRFLGWDLGGTSMNIGLLGESYANFGVQWGIVFLFFYGLAFQWAYNLAIRFTHSHPTLIIWLPLLFFYAIGVENDVLTVVNHLTKTAFFIYLLYKVYPKIFKIKL